MYIEPNIDPRWTRGWRSQPRSHEWPWTAPPFRELLPVPVEEIKRLAKPVVSPEIVTVVVVDADGQNHIYRGPAKGIEAWVAKLRRADIRVGKEITRG